MCESMNTKPNVKYGNDFGSIRIKVKWYSKLECNGIRKNIGREMVRR